MRYKSEKVFCCGAQRLTNFKDGTKDCKCCWGYLCGTKATRKGQPEDWKLSPFHFLKNNYSNKKFWHHKNFARGSGLKVTHYMKYDYLQARMSLLFFAKCMLALL